LIFYNTWHSRTLKRPISLAHGQEKQRVRIKLHEKSYDMNINTEDMDNDEDLNKSKSDDNSDNNVKAKLSQIMYASNWPSDLSFK